MKFLAISDQVDPLLYDHFNKENFKGVEFVISCGDLPKYYLEFIIDALNIPCFYVHGNHDQRLEKEPPMGWVSLEDKVITHGNFTMMGLGGSRSYNQESPYQFTEFQMKIRYLKMLPWLFCHRKINILVTHSPAYKLGDIPESLVHKGFQIFRKILKKHSPKIYLYGHAHLNYGAPRGVFYKKTPCVNAYRFRIIEWDSASDSPVNLRIF